MHILLQQIIEDSDFVENTHWRLKEFQANEVVVQVGHEARNLYFIRTGRFRVSGSVALDESRKIAPGLCELEAGDVFGELSLFASMPRSATVTTIESGTLIEIDGEALREYLDNHPELGYQLLKEMFQILTKRLVKSNHKVQNLFAWGLKAHQIDKEL